jgi:hypothetical protein
MGSMLLKGAVRGILLASCLGAAGAASAQEFIRDRDRGGVADVRDLRLRVRALELAVADLQIRSRRGHGDGIGRGGGFICVINGRFGAIYQGEGATRLRAELAVRESCNRGETLSCQGAAVRCEEDI